MDRPRPSEDLGPSNVSQNSPFEIWKKSPRLLTDSFRGVDIPVQLEVFRGLSVLGA